MVQSPVVQRLDRSCRQGRERYRQGKLCRRPPLMAWDDEYVEIEWLPSAELTEVIGHMP